MLKCQSCIVGKNHQNSYHSSNNSELNCSPLDLILADVWGPAPIVSSNGCRYYVLFIDNATRFNWIYPIERKSQVASVLKEFKIHVEVLCNKRIKSFQSDNGGEFLVLKNFLSENRIAHWKSCPHKHQQMGTVERRHRHIVDIGLALQDHAKLPLSYWYYAFTAAAFLYNRVNSPVLAGDSPY